MSEQEGEQVTQEARGIPPVPSGDRMAEAPPRREGFSQTIPLDDDGQPIATPAPDHSSSGGAEASQQPTQSRPDLSPAPTSAERKGIPENAETARRLSREPVVSRLTASTQDNEALNGDNAYSEDDAKSVADQASGKSPEDLPAEAIKRRSKEARPEIGSVDAWAEGAAGWATDVTRDGAENAETARDALKSLGIDAKGADLHGDIKAFWDQHLRGGGDIVEFAKTLAEGCKDTNGNIDLNKLDQRMESIKELFNAFGTKDDINLLVKDYAISHALLSEAQKDQNVRSELAIGVKDTIRNPVTDPSEKLRLESIYSAQEAMQREAEERREKIKDKLDKAADESETTEVVNKAHEEEARLMNAIKNGGLSQIDFDRKIKELHDKEKGIANFDTPEEFLEALRQLKDKRVYDTDEQVQQLYDHELSHYQEALERGLETKFRIQVSKDGNKLGYHPSTDPNYSSIKDPDARHEAEDAVLVAPGFDNPSDTGFRDMTENDWRSLGIEADQIAAAQDAIREQTTADKDQKTAILEYVRTKRESERKPAESTTDDTPAGEDPDQPKPTTPDDDTAPDEEPEILTEVDDEKITEVISKTGRDALTKDEYLSFKKKLNDILDKDKVKQIAPEDFSAVQERANELGRELARGALLAENAEVFERALQLLGSTEEESQAIRSTYEPAFNEASDKGQEPVYTIKLVRESGDEISPIGAGVATRKNN